MTDEIDDAWFAAVDRDDPVSAREAIESGSVDTPADWPALAVEHGFATDEADYYEALHESTVAAASAAATERERAPDQQLVHAVRALDDLGRTANELAERVTEWGQSRDLAPDAAADAGVAYARAVAALDPTDPGQRRLVSLAERVAELDDEADSLREHIETETPSVAPNLSMLAGPVLGARLISLAGGLKSLAREPSSTLQVLGAEDALFAHLRGDAPSPKHGVIYAHEYVRGTRPEKRGSAARALAGKLTIAARVDHYSGDPRPGLADDLDERIATIRGVSPDDLGGGNGE